MALSATSPAAEGVEADGAAPDAVAPPGPPCVAAGINPPTPGTPNWGERVQRKAPKASRTMIETTPARAGPASCLLLPVALPFPSEATLSPIVYGPT